MDVDACQQGRTPLGLAAAQGNLDTFDELAASGQNAQEVDCRLESPLHLAAANGHLDMVKVLVKEYKLNVNEVNCEGWTPLCFAIINNHIDAAKYLLRNGADGNHETYSGQTLLHLASWYGAAQAAEWLLAHGSDPCLETKHGVTPFDMARPGQARRLIYAAMAQQQQD